jgi:hypothetical protein
MLSKTLMGLMVGLALGATTVRLAAVSCIVTNAPSEAACKSRCCANMACCETSADRTAPAAQPLAKTGLQQNVSVMPAITVVVLIPPAAIEPIVFSSTEFRAHSPPTLALICICLI